MWKKIKGTSNAKTFCWFTARVYLVINSSNCFLFFFLAPEELSLCCNASVIHAVAYIFFIKKLIAFRLCELLTCTDRHAYEIQSRKGELSLTLDRNQGNLWTSKPFKTAAYYALGMLKFALIMEQLGQSPGFIYGCIYYTFNPI